MKRIRIDTPIKELTGENVKLAEGKLLTVKTVLLNLFGSFKGKDGEEAIQMYRVGCDLGKSTDWFVFHESDQQYIDAAVKANTVQYTIIIYGQVAELVKHAEAYKAPAEVKK